MTASTEQERAQALAEKHGATSYRNRADTQNPAYGFTPIQLAALIAEVEQAARRAPAVPVPQGLREAAQAVVERWETPLWKDVPATAVYIADLRAALAAEPQPPEATVNDSLTVEAAPVELPEPVAKIEGGSLKWHIPDAGYSLPVRYLQGTQMLYTEQQVRQLLAAHGIEVAP